MIGEGPWTDGALTAPPGVRRISLGGREALFCEARQQLCEMPPDLARLYDELAGGAQVALPATSPALGWVRSGWLAPRALFDRLARPPVHVLALRLGRLSVRIDIQSASDSWIAQGLREAFSQFIDEHVDEANAERWTIVSLGEAHFVLSARHPIRALSEAQVTPEIKARLTADLCHSTGHGELLLHSAMLERGGRGLLLAGPPGAGKTTLAVALALRGLGYLTDDVVRVTRDGAFQGTAFSPALKAGAWPLLRSRLPAIEGLATHLRADDQAVRYLPLHFLIPGASATPVAAISLRRCERSAPSLEPVDPLSMLTELLGSAFSAEHRLQAETLELIAQRFAQMTCARLVYSDLDAAAELLLARLPL